MQHILTLIARDQALSPAVLARVRDAVGGEEPVVLSPGEAADIACPGPGTPIAEALAGLPIDWAILPAAHRRHGLQRRRAPPSRVTRRRRCAHSI